MVNFKGRWFEKETIRINVRWRLACPLSYRNLEEMMAERGLSVDHSTIQRWVFTYSPCSKKFRKRKRPVGLSWRLDETCIKVRRANGSTCTGPWPRKTVEIPRISHPG